MAKISFEQLVDGIALPATHLMLGEQTAEAAGNVIEQARSVKRLGRALISALPEAAALEFDSEDDPKNAAVLVVSDLLKTAASAEKWAAVRILGTMTTSIVTLATAVSQLEEQAHDPA